MDALRESFQQSVQYFEFFFLLFNFYDYLIFRLPKIILKNADTLQGVLTRNETLKVCLLDYNGNYIGI